MLLHRTWGESPGSRAVSASAQAPDTVMGQSRGAHKGVRQEASPGPGTPILRGLQRQYRV